MISLLMSGNVMANSTDESILNIHPNGAQHIFKKKGNDLGFLSFNLPDSVLDESVVFYEDNDGFIGNVNHYQIIQKNMFSLSSLKRGDIISFDQDDYIFESVDNRFIYYRDYNSNDIKLAPLSELSNGFSIVNKTTSDQKRADIKLNGLKSDIVGAYNFTGIEWSRDYKMKVNLKTGDGWFDEFVSIKNNSDSDFYNTDVRVLNEPLVLNQQGVPYRAEMKSTFAAEPVSADMSLVGVHMVDDGVKSNIGGKDIISFNGLDLIKNQTLVIPNVENHTEVSFDVEYNININLSEFIKMDDGNKLIKYPYYKINIERNDINENLFDLNNAKLTVLDNNTLSIINETRILKTNSDFLEISLGMAEGYQIDLEKSGQEIFLFNSDRSFSTEDFGDEIKSNSSVSFEQGRLIISEIKDDMLIDGDLFVNAYGFFFIESSISKNKLEEHFNSVVDEFFKSKNINKKSKTLYVGFKNYYINAFKRDFSESLLDKVDVRDLKKYHNDSFKYIRVY